MFQEAKRLFEEFEKSAPERGGSPDQLTGGKVTGGKSSGEMLASVDGVRLDGPTRSTDSLSGGGGGQGKSVELTPIVKDLLREAGELLAKVEGEMLMIIDRDILPRFKNSERFIKYLEEEPLLFKSGGRKIAAAS